MGKAILVEAVVVKRDTEDGVSFLLDEVPIGFVYKADLCSISIQDWYDSITGKFTKRETVTIYGSATGRRPFDGRMPTELFKFEESQAVR